MIMRNCRLWIPGIKRELLQHGDYVYEKFKELLKRNEEPMFDSIELSLIYLVFLIKINSTKYPVF